MSRSHCCNGEILQYESAISPETYFCCRTCERAITKDGSADALAWRKGGFEPSMDLERAQDGIEHVFRWFADLQLRRVTTRMAVLLQREAFRQGAAWRETTSNVSGSAVITSEAERRFQLP
jgi:hypothetical protein